MNLKTAGLCISVIVILASTTLAFAVTPEESLKKNFPNIPPIDNITPSKIPGLYEVISGGRVFYYAPEAECIVDGQIIMKGGRNLTVEKYQEIEQKHLAAMALKIKDLPLDKAVKIGKGKNRVIEITDPDCPYCRKAAEFFAGRKDVTKYVFLYPLDMHQQAEPKIRYILCAKDKAKAYEQAMTGKLDDMKFKVCKDAHVDTLLKAHKEVASQLGVTGTPFFIINGQPVVGADVPLIEKLLGSKD
jgi:thiol:disulfide interchange protein DsbC